jgi:hypothetical protein
MPAKSRGPIKAGYLTAQTAFARGQVDVNGLLGDLADEISALVQDFKVSDRERNVPRRHDFEAPL